MRRLLMLRRSSACCLVLATFSAVSVNRFVNLNAINRSMCVCGRFKFYTALTPLFWLMVASKAINYALNSPSMKQLYIPTSKDVRYKSQAWIESFGSRGSKAVGSGINDLHKNALASNGPEWASKEYAKANMFKPGVDTGTYWHIALEQLSFLWDHSCLGSCCALPG